MRHFVSPIACLDVVVVVVEKTVSTTAKNCG
jgi:hypothetical protein